MLLYVYSTVFLLYQGETDEHVLLSKLHQLTRQH